MNIKYLNSNVMNVGEIIWNYNDLISSINQPIQIPYLITRKPFNNVKKIITNQVNEMKFDSKKNYVKITHEGNPIIEFEYNDERLAKAASKSWICKYYYNNNNIKITISRIGESDINIFGELLFTLNADEQVIGKEIYTKSTDDKLNLIERYQYKYIDGRLVQKNEFGPKDFDPINFDPIYNGKYELNFVVTYEYLKCKDNAWKISQFIEDKEDDKKEIFREYLFNRFGDLEYLLSYGSDQKNISEMRNVYKYDLYKNWVFKEEFINDIQKQKTNEIERRIEYY